MENTTTSAPLSFPRRMFKGLPHFLLVILIGFCHISISHQMINWDMISKSSEPQSLSNFLDTFYLNGVSVKNERHFFKCFFKKSISVINIYIFFRNPPNSNEIMMIWHHNFFKVTKEYTIEPGLWWVKVKDPARLCDGIWQQGWKKIPPRMKRRITIWRILVILQKIMWKICLYRQYYVVCISIEKT